MTGRLTLLLFMALAASLISGVRPAFAHLTPNSEIKLRIERSEVVADVVIPKGEYAFATGNPIGEDTRSLAIAKRYLEQRFVLQSFDGAVWKPTFKTVEFVQIAGPPDLHAIVSFAAPSVTDARRFTIKWNAVVDQTPNHFALFVIVDDYGAKVSEREILGVARKGQTSLDIDRGKASSFRIFAGAVSLGAHHIALGYDHMMFLLALLLPAALIARRGRWGRIRSQRSTAMNLLRIVTAFTLGHSVTLVAASLASLRLPVAPVEIAIAISVLVSAIHAIKPLAPGWEPMMALLFGLVHGLAFATLVSSAGVAVAGQALSLFGFNVGIELAQIAIVICALPAILFVAAEPELRALREGIAAFAIFCSLIWILNRASGAGDYLIGLLETAIYFVAGGIALLSIYAVMIHLLSRLTLRRTSGMSAL